VKDIVDGSERACRIQVAAVNSYNLRPHAQKTVGKIQIVVSGGGQIEFEGGSACYVRYGVIFDVNPAFDTRLRRRQREEILFALGALATALVNERHIVSRIYPSLQNVSCVYRTRIVLRMRNCEGLLGSLL
jgi:uncharacterized phage protein gp47/JayE